MISRGGGASLRRYLEIFPVMCYFLDTSVGQYCKDKFMK